jgi:hypothetical protein
LDDHESHQNAGWSKRPSSKAAASEEARRTLRYVEPLSDARTKLEDFFNILPRATALSGANRGNAIRVVFLVDHSKPAQRTFSPSSSNCSHEDCASALEPTIQDDRDRLHCRHALEQSLTAGFDAVTCLTLL